MLEAQDQFWDFDMAWWNAAIDDPARCMPKTMNYLENNFQGEELETRRQQITRGLKMGRDEILKMNKRYLLKPPLLLLMLTNRKRGAPFLRAVLSVLNEYSGRLPDGVTMINDPGDDWGRYIYTNNNDRHEDEKLWYNLLTQSDANINDLIHFWRQFYLNWPVLTGDLQRLSKVGVAVASNANVNSVSSIVDFQANYPILFECLYAVFGDMMSNSRLCEQIHGMMRHSLNPGIGMDQADHHRQ